MLTILGFSGSAGFTACTYGAEYGPDPNFYKLEVNPSALEFEHLAGETKELRITTDGNDSGYWHINISDGSYFYSKELKGVGIVESKYSDRLLFRACWADEKHYQEDGHGRFYVESETSREDVRAVKPDEIKDFWEKAESHLGIDMIIFYFGKYLKELLPSDHPIRVKARSRYKEALNTFEEQWSFIKNTYNFTLLISDEYFALLENNRIPTCPYGYGWPPDELPQHYFNIAPVKDVKGKPKENNLRRIKFEELDFSKYRAATTDELQEWLEYEDHLADLREELYGDDLPF